MNSPRGRQPHLARRPDVKEVQLNASGEPDESTEPGGTASSGTSEFGARLGVGAQQEDSFVTEWAYPPTTPRPGAHGKGRVPLGPKERGPGTNTGQDCEREEEFGSHSGPVWPATSGGDRFADGQKSCPDGDLRLYLPWPFPCNNYLSATSQFLGHQSG